MQRWERHDSYVEVKRLSKDLLHECESRARELGVTKIDTIEEEGNAAEKILQIAKDKELDTIVVGNKGLNTAEELLEVSHFPEFMGIVIYPIQMVIYHLIN